MPEKVLESFERLCIQIIIDLLLIPVTLAHLYQDSARCYSYAVRETAKQEADCFADFISSIKFSFYTSVAVSLFATGSTSSGALLHYLGSLSVAEKALVLFLVNNLTVVLFSAALIWYKHAKVNSDTFRELFQAFLYTTAYTTTPIFLLIIASMAFGKITNAEGFIEHFAPKTHYTGAGYLYILIAALMGILFLAGLYKMYRAYLHILRANLAFHPIVVFFNFIKIIFNIIKILLYICINNFTKAK